MKHFYSTVLIVLGLAILFLSLKKHPEDWVSTLLIFFSFVILTVLFFYIKKRRLKK